MPREAKTLAKAPKPKTGGLKSGFAGGAASPPKPIPTLGGVFTSEAGKSDHETHHRDLRSFGYFLIAGTNFAFTLTLTFT